MTPESAKKAYYHNWRLYELGITQGQFMEMPDIYTEKVLLNPRLPQVNGLPMFSEHHLPLNPNQRAVAEKIWQQWEQDDHSMVRNGRLMQKMEMAS